MVSFYNPSGSLLYQTSGLSCPAHLSAHMRSPRLSAERVNQATFSFSIQQAAAASAGVFSNSGDIIGLQASASNTSGGAETFYLLNVGSAASGGGGGGGTLTPEPTSLSLLVIGGLLLMAGGAGGKAWLESRPKLQGSISAGKYGYVAGRLILANTTIVCFVVAESACDAVVLSTRGNPAAWPTVAPVICGSGILTSNLSLPGPPYSCSTTAFIAYLRSTEPSGSISGKIHFRKVIGHRDFWTLAVALGREETRCVSEKVA